LRPPSLYNIQINVQIAVPPRAKDTVALFAWAKGEAKMTIANMQAVDAKWVRCAVTKQAVFFPC
jgi:hypothetical protein